MAALIYANELVEDVEQGLRDKENRMGSLCRKASSLPVTQDSYLGH